MHGGMDMVPREERTVFAREEKKLNITRAGLAIAIAIN
jgi:hypothetical protein